MTSEMHANEMLENAKLVMQEPKEGYGCFAEEMAALPKSRQRKPVVKQEIDYKAPQTSAGKTAVKREPEPALVPPPSVAKPKAKAKAKAGRGPLPEAAPVRATPLAKTTEKAAKTVAAAGGDAAALEAALAKQAAVLAAARKERDAYQAWSNTSFATVTALQKDKQLLEEGSGKKDAAIEALRGQLKDAQGANADLETRLQVAVATGKRTFTKLRAAEEKIKLLGKRKRAEDEPVNVYGDEESEDEDEGEDEDDEGEGDDEGEDEGEDEDEGSDDEATDDPDYDSAEGDEQEEQDDEDEEEEEAMERAIAVFAKRNSQGAKGSSAGARGSSAGAKGGTGPKDGKRSAGRLNREDKIKYERPQTAFEGHSLPVHSLKDIPYLFNAKPNGLPGWKDQVRTVDSNPGTAHAARRPDRKWSLALTLASFFEQEAMVAWARKQYIAANRKDSHGPGMVQDVLDLFALPNAGTTYYKDKDFLAFIEHFATWTLPEGEGKSGLSGGRHFMGWRLYPDFFTRDRCSFVRHNCKDEYERKKLLALREKVNKYWGCIWWWNKHLQINHPQRKVN